MGKEKTCFLFRRPESLNIGKGLGYCDIKSGSTTCEGDFHFCERPDALKRFLCARIEGLALKEREEQ